MQELVRDILELGSSALATEEAACNALVALRFPGGVSCPCGALCTRELADVRCARKHRFTILVGTAFESKRRPRIRALLLAIRSFASSPRSVSARELARELSIPHVTLWRHLHTLRALMPPPAPPSTRAAVVQVCGRRSSTKPAFVRAEVPVALARELANAPGGNTGMLIAESFRTWINGTFHGVSCTWLRAYIAEACTRSRGRELACATLVARLLGSGEALTFARVTSLFR